MTTWFCDCWTLETGIPLVELEMAFGEAAARVHTDQRVRRVATDSAPLPAVRFVFDLDADSEDQATARAYVVVRDATADGPLAAAHWTFRVRIVG